MIRKGQLGAIKDPASSAPNQFYSLVFLIAVDLAAMLGLFSLWRQNQALGRAACPSSKGLGCASELDECVGAFLNRQIKGDWQHLWIDPTYSNKGQ